MTSTPVDYLKIGPHRYRLDLSTSAARRLRDDEARGDSRPERLAIQIDADMAASQMASTLLHEVLHCILNQTPLRKTLEKEEEVICCALAEPLLSFLRDNPEMVYTLMKEWI